MKVLLDECLPARFKQDLSAYDVATVPDMGWAGKVNGELLRLAKDKFDVFVTVDQNLQYQQNLNQSNLAIVLLRVPNNRYQTLRNLVPRLIRLLSSNLPKGQLTLLKH